MLQATGGSPRNWGWQKGVRAGLGSACQPRCQPGGSPPGLPFGPLLLLLPSGPSRRCLEGNYTYRSTSPVVKGG